MDKKKNISLLGLCCIWHIMHAHIPINHLLAVHAKNMHNTSHNPSMEICQFICLFKREPTLQKDIDGHFKNLDGNWQKKRYVIPLSLMSSHAKSMYEHLEHKHPHYTFSIQELAYPVIGLQIDITYDTRYVTCQCDLIDTVKAQKELVLRLYDKRLLDQLGNDEKPLLRIAQFTYDRQLISIA